MSLRSRIILLFIMPMISAMGLFGYISFQNSNRAIEKLAQKLQGEINEKVSEQLTEYLSTPLSINQINLDNRELGIIDFNNFSLMEKYLWYQINQFPHIGFIGYATETGNLIGVERLDDKEIEINIMDNSSPYNLRIYNLDQKGNKIAQKAVIPNFINQQRPWYQKAVEAREATWSDVFIYQGTPRLAISAVVPIYNQENQLEGVLFSDLLLSLISNFLKDLSVSKTGEIIIVDDNNYLVASSLEKPFIITNPDAKKIEQQPERISLENSQHEKIRQLSTNINKKFSSLNNLKESQFWQVKLDNQYYFIQAFPYNNYLTKPWYILILIPKQDLVGDIEANTKLTIIIWFFILLIALFLALWTTNYITKPILLLDRALSNFQKGNHQSPIILKRRDELGHLAIAFNEMTSEIQELVQNLEEKVKDRTKELSEAKDKAEVANQAKSEFLANMSHELRTPLNAILGFAQIMRKSPTLPEEHQESIEIINRSGEHLLTLINNILDLSKIEAGKITLNKENIDLYKLLDEIEDIFKYKAEKKGIHLIFQKLDNLPQFIKTDAPKLRQIIINLVSNAIKFTEEGGVSLQGTINKLNNNEKKVELLFIIRDTGKGIKHQELATLFQPFTQTKSGKEVNEGTGLGLSISKKFVELMGGNIKVSSEENVGTIFSFTVQTEIIPDYEVKSNQIMPQVVGIEANEKTYKILIVDDKEINCQLLVKLLKPFGFELKEANNGKQAVKIWEKWQPHLIFMDMRMPVMDGYEATKIIKGTTKGNATAIIAVTASVLEEEKAIILSAGCDDFVRKPFRQETIFSMLSKHLGVNFIYEQIEENQSTEIISELTAKDFVAMPQEWLKKLYKASIDLDEQLILDLIQEIPDSHKSLIQGLKNIVDSLEFDRITTLIDEI
ncbi:hybrid sensor histidine kinase/response regulator [Cyanobacterium aponinum]|uniref:Circadian input-output histidine kinase CikA n=1 Tax=Cyanobacterium aponinum 0216 TaxID=2676140 RepID=A0A844GRT8_9CHRO|nr:hybrid sensor histidine kinase/response regulator [Cyanobacterium aponinum]MTF37772.1 response regulator [Cyanobacterium aponinum 0216]